MISTTSSTTSTSTTTASTTTASIPSSCSLTLQGKNIKEIKIWGGSTIVVGGTTTGCQSLRWVQIESLQNDHLRGYIEFIHNNNRWKRGNGEFVYPDKSNGTVWRITPHPTKVVWYKFYPILDLKY